LFDDARQALGGHIAADFLFHLDEDELASAAVLAVLLQHGVSGRAAAGEAVEDDGVGRRTMIDNFLNQTQWLRKGEDTCSN
jgi:hypothetical protein